MINVVAYFTLSNSGTLSATNDYCFVNCYIYATSKNSVQKMPNEIFLKHELFAVLLEKLLIYIKMIASLKV